MVARRAFSKGPIPTSSSVSVDGTKVVGLNHLSVSSDYLMYRLKLAIQPMFCILISNYFFISFSLLLDHHSYHRNNSTSDT